MNIRHLIGLVIGIVLAVPSQAQFNFASSAVPAFGFGTNIFIASDNLGSSEALASFYSLELESYFVLAQKNDFVSVGVQTGLIAGGAPTQATNQEIFFNYNLQIPLHAMVRVGSNSSPYNTQTLGVGAGIGLTGTRLAYVIGTLRSTATFFNPSATLEASYGRTIFRISFDLWRPQDELLQTNIITGADAPSRPAGLGFIQYGILVAI
ncbi:MAG: hypothetical protein AAFR59_06075 [Bacteroidota bacterium]